MKSCEVLPPRISALLVPLRELVEQLSIRERLPQIEMALGEDVDVLVLRILEPLTSRMKRCCRHLPTSIACSSACSPRARKRCSRSIRWMRRS